MKSSISRTELVKALNETIFANKAVELEYDPLGLLDDPMAAYNSRLIELNHLFSFKISNVPQYNSDGSPV